MLLDKGRRRNDRSPSGKNEILLHSTLILLSYTEIDMAAYEKEYPKSLFNKGVRAKNEDHVGHVAKETDGKIVVFGDRDYRYDITKSKIIAVGRKCDCRYGLSPNI